MDSATGVHNWRRGDGGSIGEQFAKPGPGPVHEHAHMVRREAEERGHLGVRQLLDDRQREHLGLLGWQRGQRGPEPRGDGRGSGGGGDRPPGPCRPYGASPASSPPVPHGWPAGPRRTSPESSRRASRQTGPPCWRTRLDQSVSSGEMAGGMRQIPECERMTPRRSPAGGLPLRRSPSSRACIVPTFP